MRPPSPVFPLLSKLLHTISTLSRSLLLSSLTHTSLDTITFTTDSRRKLLASFFFAPTLHNVTNMPGPWNEHTERKLLLCLIDRDLKPNWTTVAANMGAEFTAEAARSVYSDSLHFHSVLRCSFGYLRSFAEVNFNFHFYIPQTEPHLISSPIPTPHPDLSTYIFNPHTHLLFQPYSISTIWSIIHHAFQMGSTV